MGIHKSMHNGPYSMVSITLIDFVKLSLAWLTRMGNTLYDGNPDGMQSGVNRWVLFEGGFAFARRCTTCVAHGAVLFATWVFVKTYIGCGAAWCSLIVGQRGI